MGAPADAHPTLIPDWWWMDHPDWRVVEVLSAESHVSFPFHSDPRAMGSFDEPGHIQGKVREQDEQQ